MVASGPSSNYDEADFNHGLLGKILHGESTAPGATHFFVYHSTMSKVLDTLYAPIDVSIDVEARKGSFKVDGVVESEGRPIVNPFSGGDARARIHLPEGFEYTFPEMGNGTSTATGEIKMEFTDTYGQFSELHMTQDGVIR